MQYNYSQGFKKLIKQPPKLKRLLVDSSFGGTFDAWEKRKAFISGTINKNGTFLDIGCGNGFLLRSLQEWSKYKIVPFGIDINEQFIQEAKKLFTENPENFIILKLEQISEISNHLPSKYDFVYYSLLCGNDSKLIKNLSQYVKSGGRLIIGFYGEDKNQNLLEVKQLESLGIKFSRVLENTTGTNLVAYIEM